MRELQRSFDVKHYSRKMASYRDNFALRPFIAWCIICVSAVRAFAGLYFVLDERHFLVKRSRGSSNLN
jgi:hypothetical protein